MVEVADILAYLSWVLVGGGILGAFILSAFVVWLLSHANEKAYLAKISSTISISLSLLTIVLIPSDIYNTSSVSLDSESEWNTVFEIFYYILFLSVISMCGVSIFLYFYYEESIEEGTSLKKKVRAGTIAVTIAFVAMIVILLLGLFIHGSAPEAPPDSSSTTQVVYSYLQSIVDSGNILLDSASFGYFMFTAIGFLLFWLTYTAYGLSAIGINHIRGKKRKEDEENETKIQIEKLRTQIDDIREKFEGTKIPVKIRIELEGLEERKSYEEKKLTELNEISKFSRISEILSPIQFLFGAIIYLISIVIIVSIIVTLINRLVDSECLMQCGFTMTNSPTLPNPLDLALTYSSMFFPLDCILFAVIVLYILFSTLYGISMIGIRFIWIMMFVVKIKKTRPQAMIVVSIIMMFCIFCLFLEVPSIAPQYSTYGSRTYINDDGNSKFCDMNAGADVCPMTAIATIVNRFQISLNLFASVFYVGTWVFIGAFFIGSAISIFLLKRQSNVTINEPTVDIEEDDL